MNIPPAECAATLRKKLLQGAVAIWHMPLWPLQTPSRTQRSWLDDVELDRAQGYKSDLARSAFLTVRIALRQALAAVTGTSKEAIKIGYTMFGKPVMSNGAGHIDWEFSVSRTNRCAVIAIAYKRRIGIDIEAVSQSYRTLRPVAESFTSAELNALDKLSPSEAQAAFYHCWTCKEAILKGLGLGISIGLNRLEVVVEGECGLRWIDPSIGDQNRWKLCSITHPAIPRSEYACALATEGLPSQLILRAWPLRC